MSLIFRKIDRAKWLQNNICAGEDVSADAITTCMRTKGNALSTWEFRNETESDEAALALVAGAEHLETIDVISLDSEYLKQNGISCVQTEGKTHVGDLRRTHLDLSELSYQKLGTIAYHTVERIKEKKLTRYTEGRLKKILRVAIEAGRVEVEDLPESVRKKLNL